MQHPTRSRSDLLRSIVLVSLLPLAAGAQAKQLIDDMGDGMGNVLFDPRGIALDSQGNVYVLGTESHNAFMISDPGLPSQTIRKIFDRNGDGMGNGASIELGDIDVDAAGNVYIACAQSDNVFMISDPGQPTQTTVQIMDGTGDGTHPLDAPEDGSLAVDAAGNVFVAGSANDNVFMITSPGQPSQTITLIMDASGDTMGNTIRYVGGLATDSAGSLYVAGYASDNGFKIEDPGLPTQQITLIINSQMAGTVVDGARGFAVDTSGNAYLAAESSDNVLQIAPGGAITVIANRLGDGCSPLGGSFGIATDSAGSVYVAGAHSYNVFVITDPGLATQSIQQIIDRDGDQAGNDFRCPYGNLVVDPAGTVYATAECSGNAFQIVPTDDSPMVYCTAKSGLVCGTPTISFSGASSATSSSGFEISASPARDNRTGLLLYTDAGRANLPFQGGTLCLDPSPLRRTVPTPSGGSPGQCDGRFALDMNCFASGACGGNPDSFLTIPCGPVYCQWWGRDSVATGSFLSDALEYIVGF